METIDLLKAGWKNLLSHLSKDWQFKNYPIRVRKQSTEIPYANSHLIAKPYHAQIINWWLSGIGDTKEEAIRDLESNFKKYSESNKLPRPGSRVPIQFADTGKIDAHGEFAFDFVQKIFNFSEIGGPVFISDESSLYDFDGLLEGITPEKKILDTYGVDVTDIPDRKIWKILDKIKSNQEY